ncbi:MAG TPA: CDP-diacylglycerol--serine O-phosphatidyltransferase [Phycisphaerae bacterium]|nr:CDP-diacylglycerol--serine O-phosphatidyltransferase [Phycisphaerae bacterium]
MVSPQTEDPLHDLDDRAPPAPDTPARRRRGRLRRRILRSTALWPALFTIGNAMCGFAAIHFATKDAVGQASLTNIAVAGWLIVAAMVCDLLDGRLARMTRRTSDFGGQLDSLSDVISFGAAPAVLMVRTVVTVLPAQVRYVAVERMIMCVAGVYLACAALRLARFNVENEPDESAHMHFWGLPTPAAAAGITTLVLLFARMRAEGWIGEAWLSYSTSALLPAVALAGALLMVSRIRYPHLINQYIRRRSSVGYLVRLLLVGFAVLLQPLATAAVVSVGYMLWSPLRAAWRGTRGQPAASH